MACVVAHYTLKTHGNSAFFLTLSDYLNKVGGGLCVLAGSGASANGN